MPGYRLESDSLDGVIWAVDFPNVDGPHGPPTLVSYSAGSWNHIGGSSVDDGASEGVHDVAVGSDGTVWILIGDELASVSNDGLEVAEFDGPGLGSPMFLTTAPDGAVWVVVQSDHVVDRLGVSDVLAYIIRYDGSSSSTLEVPFAEIAALESQERQILEKATALGEDVSLSVLTGAADQNENAVLEFLDRAEALGLVKSRFEINDETMHFLGKRVLDISYGTIDEERRLFYVAVTRARWRLAMSAARTRQRYGRTVEREESRFIGEIDPARLDVVDSFAAAPADDASADHYLDKLKRVFSQKRQRVLPARCRDCLYPFENLN